MKRYALLSMGLCSLFLAGCVEGQVSTFMTYDEKADSFRVLQVYANLAIGDAKDVDHLEMLWKKRENMVIQPFQIAIFSMDVYERAGKNRYIKRSAGEPAMMPLAEQDTKIDLESIKVLPGEFYLNSHGNLSYYHRIEVPGKTVDDFLKEAAPLLAEEIVKLAEEEKQLTKIPKAAKQSWDSVRKELIDDLLKKEEPAPAPMPEAPELSPFDPATIEMFAKCAKDGTVKLVREKGVIAVTLPMAKADAEEIIKTGAAVRVAIAAKLKEKDELDLKLLQKGLESMQAKYIEKVGLEIRFDALLLQAMFQLTGAEKPDGNPDPTKKAAYADLINKVAARNIPVAKEPKIAEILKEFGK